MHAKYNMSHAIENCVQLILNNYGNFLIACPFAIENHDFDKMLILYKY
jgi:hypothetical protein